MGTRNGTKRGPYKSRRRELAPLNMQQNGGVVGEAMRQAGFSEEYSRQPQKFAATLGFQKLAEVMLPDLNILKTHRELLEANRIDLIKFPWFNPDAKDNITDDEIKEMLLQINCIVQRITTIGFERHVYFSCPDNKARKDAIDLAYKLKGYIKTGGAGGPVVPVQINFNSLREKYK